jgi:thiol:disulfide interchange protein DsbD
MNVIAPPDRNEEEPMQKKTFILAILVGAILAVSGAQGFNAESVFTVDLVPDRQPVVAGEVLQLAAIVKIEPGWHVNSDEPGDEFSMPTTVKWLVPEGWPEPMTIFPDGDHVEFEFADGPIEVWEGEVVLVGRLTVPETAIGSIRPRVEVTAQACNDTQCLPPVGVKAGVDLEIVAPGTASEAVNQKLFDIPAKEKGTAAAAPDDDASRLAGMSLPLLLVTVFFGGLALNLTPCVFPLIPITIGFFSQQKKDGVGGAFGLAFAYFIGIALTYSVLGVLAALGGAIFGGALQNPIVVGVIVLVMLALAASMFGAWEIRPPAWAMQASGGRGGMFGSLIMGLLMGIIAAPCIGPFVIGLLTYVGQKGDPVFGFFVFFALASGLGLPYLLLGTFTGLVNRLPASGAWMIGVRRVFGVILIAMAAYFAAPMLPGHGGDWLMGLTLALGALYLLVIDRTGNEQPGIDRVMRLVCAGLLVVGLSMLPIAHGGGSAVVEGDHLEWAAFDEDAFQEALDSGQTVIVDFYADWCAPCRELDEKTFSDPRVKGILDGFVRFKVDQTRASKEAVALTKEFKVLGVPTVMVYRDGAEVFRITGFESAEQFLPRIQ